MRWRCRTFQQRPTKRSRSSRRESGRSSRPCHRWSLRRNKPHPSNLDQANSSKQRLSKDQGVHLVGGRVRPIVGIDPISESLVAPERGRAVEDAAFIRTLVDARTRSSISGPSPSGFEALNSPSTDPPTDSISGTLWPCPTASGINDRLSRLRAARHELVDLAEPLDPEHIAGSLLQSCPT